MAGKKFLIAGLGNIGPEYEGTRHNIGFMVLDNLVKGSGTIFITGRLGSTATISYKGNKLLLLKPSTYMNLSGKAVNYWMQEEKIPLENILVVSDDLALPFGHLRMRKKGSNGGHNGLLSVEECLNTNAFCRLRIGISSDFSRGGQIDYVLGKIDGEELKQLPEVLDNACEAVKAFTFAGPDRAMNQFNTKKADKPDGAE
ncbi:MAG: aminoacyl-tRNA hydrolase [Bacteroidales bacterium]|jgi:peptidyl-tRNA hydrolase, PTH1 family|nr:aminoacyl-tRNA hydrolase [Bacteroidales bacterium]MCI1733978.1 aminoacyl-tRNA hydrolase [Bacteroidales bacterium]